MANINRDYLIVNDVKKSNIRLDNGSMFFYITDKNTQNIFVNLVINVSKNDLIQKYANIENAEDYTLTMNIVKPGNTYKIIEGKLHNKEKAIFEFDLKEDCCDEVGTYKCELLTKCNINDHEEITTSNKLTYKVKSSVLNDLDEIQEAPEYPLVIQLFDKLSDIEQYEEDRRANELARQLAEEQRQARFDTLDADMVDRVTAMDDKMVDVENRVSTKEQAVDKLIVDTKADIDEYKVAKDQEIDEYKTAKDTEINNAIANQDNKIDTAISEQNDRITVVENNGTTQDNRLDVLENKDVSHKSRLDAIEVKNQQQDNRLDIVENKNTQQDNRLNDIEAKNAEQDNRLDDIEAIDVAQNSRLDAIESKNQQQDDRLLDIEKVNKRQDMNLKCLFAESKNNMIDVTEEGNSIYLQNSTTGYTLIDEIKGNTLVNCNKEPDKELILNGNINTSGDNTVTITEGVDGGLVDVALEGNTLVNVSKTKDSTAITKAYTVENSGNHIALQGDIDGSCRPVVTGNTLVNLLQKREPIDLSKEKNTGFISLNIPNKLNTEYTMIINLSNLNLDGQSDIALAIRGYLTDNTFAGTSIDSSRIKNNVVKLKWTETEKQFKNIFIGISNSLNTNNPTFTLENIILLEGDYTDKPIPDYFTGLQSTFEDNLVTQEKVDSGEEVADNLGKYRVDYKVTGKNKINNDLFIEGVTLNPSNGTETNNRKEYKATKEYISVTPGANLRLSLNAGEFVNLNIICFYDNEYNFISSIKDAYTHNQIVVPQNAKYLRLRVATQATDVQLEEGTETTSYEPYKESTKTLYLNLPLLEGDTIEEKDGGIYHVHRSGKYTFTDNEPWNIEQPGNFNTYYCYIGGVISNIPNKPIFNVLCDKIKALGFADRSRENIYVAYNNQVVYTPLASETVTNAWLQNKTAGATIIYPLATPQYELIEQSNLVIPSYTNGHLDFDTAVPIERVEFKPFGEELAYLYANTQYAVQFVSDKATTADITLGGTSLLSQSITQGLNRISITTPATLVDNRLVIDGVGANISEVVVTDTNREFMYFEGMKSVGECEDNAIEILSRYGNLVDIFDNALNSKPIYPYRNNNLNEIKPYLTYFNLVDGFNDCNNLYDYYYVNNETALLINLGTKDRDKAVDVLNRRIAEGMNKLNSQQLTHEPLRAVGDAKDRYVLIDGKWYIERNCKEVVLDGSESWSLSSSSVEGCIRVFTVLSKSAYPQWGNNNFNCISNYLCTPRNSSEIPTANSGYIYTPNTSRYILFTNKATDTASWITYLQSNPLTLIYQLASPQYEPIDYNPLEVYSGTTYITTNSVIPTNIIVKNHGYNCLLKPSTTYTVSSNLGLNTVTTPSTLTEDCLRFMDTDTSDVTTMKDVLVLEGDWTTKADLIPANFSGIESAFEQEYDAEKGKYKVNAKVANEDKSEENNITFYINEPLRGVGGVKDKVFIKDDKVVVQRNCGIRPYEDGDFGTYLTDKINTVYPLAEPTYEEIEYNDTKLFIESFKNSTLFYNSNVPVTSKLYYSYSVPIVDTVAQTASITDEQDSMIIDLATQCAVMEMMLM